MFGEKSCHNNRDGRSVRLLLFASGYAAITSGRASRIQRASPFAPFSAAPEAASNVSKDRFSTAANDFSDRKRRAIGAWRGRGGLGVSPRPLREKPCTDRGHEPFLSRSPPGRRHCASLPALGAPRKPRRDDLGARFPENADRRLPHRAGNPPGACRRRRSRQVRDRTDGRPTLTGPVVCSDSRQAYESRTSATRQSDELGPWLASIPKKTVSVPKKKGESDGYFPE